MKKVLLILLAALSFNAVNAEITWNLSDDGTLTISGTDMRNYYGDAPWESQRDKIKKLVIENGVTTIGGSAFKGCQNLTSVTFPNSVEKIEYFAFSGCSNLTSITIPSSVTYIGDRAFEYCEGLASIIVEKGNTTFDSRDNCNAIIYTYFNSLIVGCKNTVIPNSVTSIGNGAFKGSYGLTSITIPNSVTRIEKGAFSACHGLTSINIANSVTDIEENAFEYCYNLKAITIPNSITNINDRIFEGCAGLTSVTIPNSVTSIGSSVFNGCKNLTTITIPHSVTSLDRNAFYGCKGLTSIIIPNSVTNISSGAFSNCPNLTSITVEKGNMKYDSRDNCNAIIETKYNSLIVGCKNTVIPNSVTSIEYEAFKVCPGLTTITIPNSVRTIGNRAFFGCPDLKSLIIPNSVTHIGWAAFLECLSLKSITIPSSVTAIERHTFCDCSSLTSIAIPETVNFIGEYAFQNCSSLTSITIPNAVTTINNDAFSGCTGLTSITCGATTPPDCRNSWYGEVGLYCFDSVNESIPLYVPANSIDAYKNANMWNEFTNIQAIPYTYTLTDGTPYNNFLQLDGCDISYTRTFNNTAWQALYIPFSLSYTDWKDDFEVAYINGIRQQDSNGDGVADKTIVDITTIKDGSLIPNTPYLIKAKEKGTKTLSVTDATLYEAKVNSIDCSTTLAKYTFTGTYNKIPAATLIDNEFYAMGGGSLIMTDGTSDLNPYRWYMSVEARSPMYNASNAAKTIVFNVLDEDGNTTGINESRMMNEELPNNGSSVYDLNGRKVNEKTLKPGMYIKNGKKVIVK